MADAGALTTTEQASTNREGQYILINNRPCKVLDVLDAFNSRRRNGCRFVGRDIFTKNRRVSSDFSPRDNVVVQMLNTAGEFKEFQVTDRTLLNRILLIIHVQIGARLTADRQLDRELLGRYLVVTVLSAMREEQISAFKAINPIYPL